MKTLIAVLLSTTSALARVCPYPTTENVDGCNSAPAASAYTVRHSNFFTGYAQQSGQTYFNSHPPQWNVAGVDYPVGIHRLYASALKSPVNIASDPAAPGCSYGNNFVLCTAASKTVVNGYDFTQPNGCTNIEFEAGAGDVTLENSKFAFGATCTALDSGYIAEINNHGNITIQYNYFNDAKPASQSVLNLAYVDLPSQAAVGSSSNKILIQYNAFIHGPVRMVGSNTCSDLYWRYNYAEGMVYNNSGEHGETILSGCNSSTQKNQVWEYSTFLQPSTTFQNGTTGVNGVVTANEAGGVIQNFTFDHMVQVANIDASTGHAPVGTVGVEGINPSGFTSTGFPTLTNNWLDPTGAYFCFYNTEGGTWTTAPVETENLNLRDGSAITGGGGFPGTLACNGAS